MLMEVSFWPQKSMTLFNVFQQLISLCSDKYLITLIMIIFSSVTAKVVPQTFVYGICLFLKLNNKASAFKPTLQE